MMTMANCKICGKPVRCANVFHSACWETAAGKTIQTFCDDYCRWPRECANETELEEQHCDSCALVKVLNLGL